MDKVLALILTVSLISCVEGWFRTTRSRRLRRRVNAWRLLIGACSLGGGQKSVAHVCILRRPTARLLGALIVAVLALTAPGCKSKDKGRQAENGSHSTVTVVMEPGGLLAIRTSAAEFEILESGYIRASLIRNAKRVALDDPQTGAASSEGYPVVDGKPIEDFVLDLTHARIADYQSRVGPREAD